MKLSIHYTGGQASAIIIPQQTSCSVLLSGDLQPKNLNVQFHVQTLKAKLNGIRVLY